MNLEHISRELILFFILYGITGVVPLIAALYLLLRRANAIAPGVTPPLRLRRWTASFFAVSTLAHVWWILFYISSCDEHSVSYMLIVMLDCVLLFTTFTGMLLAMLQDRRRPVWPALVALIPFVALWGTYMAFPSILIEQITAAYLVLLGLLFAVHMVVAIRQYGRWLNDNYADLENKKVWLCQTVALVSMLLFIFYVLATDMVFIWLIHIINLVLVVLLVWRVETLPLLESTSMEDVSAASAPDTSDLPPLNSCPPQQAIITNIDLAQIDRQLNEHCIDTQLYLQHDLTVQQLAQAIGTNRYYLSQYFSRKSITYNTYINNLRIDYFIKRYQELTAGGQSIGAQQLARESGYHSYSTFSLAFKQRTGQSVTAWIRDAGGGNN
jgi:AraC-like DNA-binding protein